MIKRYGLLLITAWLLVLGFEVEEMLRAGGLLEILN